jgi:hypothetical protein
MLCTFPQSRTPTYEACGATLNYNAGCGVKFPTASNVGPAFNTNGGGWFAYYYAFMVSIYMTDANRYTMERSQTYVAVRPLSWMIITEAKLRDARTELLVHRRVYIPFLAGQLPANAIEATYPIFCSPHTSFALPCIVDDPRIERYWGADVGAKRRFCASRFSTLADPAIMTTL